MKRQVMPFFNPYGMNFMNSAAPMQTAGSVHGGVHTIPSLQHHYQSHGHHHQQHHPKAIQTHHYGTPHIPYLGGHDASKALALIGNKRLMFGAILKATIKLYVELGILLSMMIGTLWFTFGSAFTRLAQTALHGVGNAFLHLGTSIHTTKS